MRTLKNSVALVTGASRGIGLAISECLASAGATVILNGWNKESFSRAVDGLCNKGCAAEGILFDASDEVEVDRPMREIAAQHQRLDILVNNAGVVLGNDAFETTLEEWNGALKNNLNSAFLCSRAALRIMREKANGGRIIMIGSTADQRGAPAGAVAYSKSTAGL